MPLDTLTRPNISTLILFGLAATSIIIGALYVLSFLWWFQRDAILTFVCAPVLIFFLVSLWLDKKFSTKIKRYSILTVAILGVSLLLLGPTKKWFIKTTEQKGKAIQTAVIGYKIKFGDYPTSLDDPFFSDLNKYALPFRPFHYQVYHDKQIGPTFELYYISFDGYVGHLFGDADKWHYVD